MAAKPISAPGLLAWQGTAVGWVWSRSLLAHPPGIPINALGHCGFRDDSLEFVIILDTHGGDFTSSELTEERRRLIEFDDRATRLGLEVEHSQRGIKCRTDVMTIHLDRQEWIADQVLLGLPVLADHQEVRTMVDNLDNHKPLLALHRLQRLLGGIGCQAFQL